MLYTMKEVMEKLNVTRRTSPIMFLFIAGFQARNNRMLETCKGKKNLIKKW